MTVVKILTITTFLGVMVLPIILFGFDIQILIPWTVASVIFSIIYYILLKILYKKGESIDG